MKLVIFAAAWAAFFPPIATAGISEYPKCVAALADGLALQAEIESRVFAFSERLQAIPENKSPAASVSDNEYQDAAKVLQGSIEALADYCESLRN